MRSSTRWWFRSARFTRGAIESRCCWSPAGSSVHETEVDIDMQRKPRSRGLAQPGVLVRLHLEAGHRPAQRVAQRTADEDRVSQRAEGAGAGQRVLQAQLHAGALGALDRLEGLPAGQAVLE